MEINRLELLSYLGYRGQKITDEMNELITKAIQICYDNVKLKHVVKRFKVDREKKEVIGANLKLYGQDIWQHIEGCDEIYLFAATIGFDVEKLIARYLVEDKTLAIILDSAAVCAIESYCDDICASFKENVTERYSCGYGDFDIKEQLDICRVLDTNRKIGLFVSSSYMMSPQKSVTAVVGIKNGR